MAVAKAAPGKTTDSPSRVEDVVRSTVSAVKCNELKSKVTAARLLQLWELATPSILSASTDRAGELHRHSFTAGLLCPRDSSL